MLAVTTELYAYWNGLRGARAAPERNDIDPGAIRGVLPDTFVLDFDERGGFPFRIAGSRANALFLRELRGVSFLELWRDADRPDLSAILHCVAGEVRPVLIGAKGGPLGLGSVDIEVILLPLRHHGLVRARVLGALAATATPDWMGLIEAGPLSVATQQPLRLAAATEDQRAGSSLHNAPRRY
ncbi:MAG: PAS domain-containing protein, partial [Hyphomicrobiales bacterium]|nr:PAS domain-containing protein [Hyphomicrobiales bacterium]